MTNKELYKELTRARYKRDPYRRDKDKGGDMEVLNEVIGQYWRQRYLINHADKEAYELMGNLTTFGMPRHYAGNVRILTVYSIKQLLYASSG